MLLKDLKWSRSKRHNGFEGKKKSSAAPSLEWNGLGDKPDASGRTQTGCINNLYHKAFSMQKGA
jgi:hypothetical protein